MLGFVHRACSALAYVAVISSMYISLAPLTSHADSLITKEFALDGVSSIAIEGHSKVRVTLGETEYMRLTGTKERLENIQANMEEDRLILLDHNKQGRVFKGSARVQIEIQLRDMQLFEFEGDHIVSVNALLITDLFLEGNGFDEVLAKDINVENMEIYLRGTQTMHVDNIHNKSLAIVISGTGELNIDAALTESHDLDISGRGEIAFRKTGEATVLSFKIAAPENFKSGQVNNDRAPVASLKTAGMGKVQANRDVFWESSRPIGGNTTYFAP